MKDPVNVAASLLIVALAAAPAAAMEWLSSDDLERSCDSFLADSASDDGALCLAYMQGFIAGSGTADASAEGERDAAEDESFTERATRTRLGTLRLQRIRNIGDGGHCLGDDVAAVKVVEKIADYLEEHPETLKLTNAEAVREALVYHYPCPK